MSAAAWKTFIVTIVMTLVAAALALGALDQVRPLIATTLPGPVRGFLFEFRFALGILAAFIVLGVAEIVVGALARAFGRDR